MDPRLVIEGAFAVASFFAALWIRGIRDDMKEIVKQVANHGERLAVAESKIDRLEKS